MRRAYPDTVQALRGQIQACQAGLRKGISGYRIKRFLDMPNREAEEHPPMRLPCAGVREGCASG